MHVEPAVASLAIRELMHGPRRDGRVIGTADGMVLAEFGGVTSEPRVIVIAAPEAVRLPNSVTTPAVPLNAPPGTHVRAGDERLTIAGITLAPLRWWDPVPVLGPLSRARLDHGATTLARICGQSQHAPGLPGHNGPAALAACCAEGDLASAAEHAESLVGLGPGLVPAGDSVLCGMLLALRLLGGAIPGGTKPVWLAGWLSATVTAYARERTIGLGASVLHCAARGQAPAEVSAVLHGLAGDEPVEPAARKLQSTGSWLADIAWGIVAGCRAAQVLSVS
ncbi:MAG: DUF2877 domain-containing protein [Streptosporangiaceae bacterium]